ncbi:MAG: sulfotransferase [Planctomycetota bacterium]
MTTVIVLGMHRSGTSCLAGSLQASDLELGEVHTANPHNKKGNRENQAVMDLHESLLAQAGASWDAPAVVTWDEEHRKMRDAIIEGFRETPMWGFKDPRTCFTLDGWLEVLPQTKLVGTFRNPKSVALSLVTRNRGMGDMEDWYKVWEAYNKQVLHYHREHAFPIVDFDASDAKYLKSLRVIYQHLGLQESAWNCLKALDFKGFLANLGGKGGEVFFDPKLRSSVTSDVDGLPESTVALYRELQKAAIR